METKDKKYLYAICVVAVLLLIGLFLPDKTSVMFLLVGSFIYNFGMWFWYSTLGVWSELE